MPSPRLLPQFPTSTAPIAAPALDQDMLYGVEEIRVFLGLRTVKQVRKLRERGKAPIISLEGVGLAARRSALRSWIERKEREAVAPAP